MSYLNVVRAGCVEIDRTHQLDDRFIDDCVQTLGMENYQIDNDLEQPRYVRYPITLWQKSLAEGDQEKAEELQTLLNKSGKTICKLLLRNGGVSVR